MQRYELGENTGNEVRMVWLGKSLFRNRWEGELTRMIWLLCGEGLGGRGSLRRLTCPLRFCLDPLAPLCETWMRVEQSQGRG